MFDDILRAKLRTPLLAMAALMTLLLVNSLLGLFVRNGIWPLEVLLAAVMVATVLLFSMELVKAPPLVRLFGVLGFLWVGILFGLTMLDYATR